jgi:two-component system, NarL family, response regulator DegU
MDKPISVCLTDDHQLFRKAMTRLLATFPRVGEIYEAENGKQCLDQVAKHHVDVVLLDIEMPVLNGMDTARALVRDFPDVKIITLTMHDSESYLKHLLDTGVHSFLLKSTDPQELENAISAVVDRDFYHNDLIVSAMRRAYVQNRKLQQALADFEISEREIEILRLLYDDIPQKEIATRLNVSEHTIHRHKHNLQQKLKVNGTIGLIKWAFQKGIIT